MRKTRAAFIAIVLTAALRAGAADVSALKPPPGARVAIVMFADLEGPDCANAYPLVLEAANAHRIPVVLHDFPLPRHSWSFDAAVWARYFDSKSAQAGNEFRRFIFANQRQITYDNLPQWVQKFGDQNKLVVPVSKDAAGNLTERVKADYAFGQRVGVEHTPTIWVVGDSSISQPLVHEVKDRAVLNQMIEDMLAKEKAAPVRPAAKNRVAPNAHKNKRSLESNQ